jgi:uncharacterized protein (TIGR03545 family)
MSNLLRWQYVVPRVLAVVVGLLAIQYGLCLLTRARVERAVAATIGAKGELAAARVSFVDGRVLLRGLEIADPRQPQRNLLEADCCDLIFDADALVRRRQLIGHGEITGLKFLAPRESSGALTNSQAFSSQPIAAFGGPEVQTIADWMKELDARYAQDPAQQLESVRLTADLADQGSRHIMSLQRRLAELETHADNLRKRADAAELNPLRSGEFFASLPKEIAGLQSERAALTAELDRLPDKLETGRRAVVAARVRDERTLRERLAVNDSISHPLAAYLLREQVNGVLSDAIDWLRWMRHVAPAEPRQAGDRLPLGPVAVHASGDQPPGFLLRNLALAGVAHVGGQPVDLRGTLTDFTTQPWSLDGPMRLRLVSTGSPAVKLQGSIDRSGTVARDELLMDFQGATLSPFMLGRADGLSVSVGPSIAAVNISILLNGDELSGEIQIVQSGAQLATAIGDDLAHVPVATALEDTLGDVNALATRLSLRGTLAEPRCTLWSSIGPAAAAAMDLALRRAAEERTCQWMGQSLERINEQLAHLDRHIAEEQGEMAPRLAGSTGQLSGMAARFAPPPRLDAARLGRLPADSLFR